MSMAAPREAVPEMQELPPSTQEKLTAGPIGDAGGDLGAPTTNAEKYRW
jgi:hypothetical protein